VCFLLSPYAILGKRQSMRSERGGDRRGQCGCGQQNWIAGPANQAAFESRTKYLVRAPTVPSALLNGSMRRTQLCPTADCDMNICRHCTLENVRAYDVVQVSNACDVV